MKQRTHTWLAIRAVALLDDLDEADWVVKLLKPHVRSTAIGAWIPDLKDAKKGGSKVENHILKMKPYTGSQAERFTVDRQKILKKLGTHRRIHAFLKKDRTLNPDWWATPYKAEPKPGQHLADRSQALTITIDDQLILGDPPLAAVVPGNVRFASNLHPNARTRREETATYFFMLTHFIADSCMPCHCDNRFLASYDNGLHKELEAHWNKVIGTYFEKGNILSTNASSRTILKEAKKIDKKFGVDFSTVQTIPKLMPKNDVWLEMLYVCRGSFAVSNILAHPNQYPFTSRKKAPYATLFAKDGPRPDLLQELDEIVIHDSVLNIAIVWKHIWNTFKLPDA